MPCLDPDSLAAWFDRDLPAGERTLIEAHLETCIDCRTLVIELARDVGAEASGDAASEELPPAVGARVGRYVVIDWLGSGGMGVVYAAYDPELDRRVALKLLRSTQGGAPAQARLLREARAAARVSHPNVIAVHDAGTHEGQVFVAMELVRGQTLADWMRSARPTLSIALAHFVEAARGLSAVHRAGLVHGDFKPSNVLVSDDGRVRVTDFGLARFGDDGDEGAPGSDAERPGTPRYMSPEQRAGGPADARSDQYSFCVALRDSISGEDSADGPSATTSARLPARVRRVLARGLAEEPGARFPSMDALSAMLAGRPSAGWLGVAVALPLVVLLALGAVLYARDRAKEANVCAGAERKLVGIWDEPRRQTLSTAFAATGAPYADEVGHEVRRRLDAYATSWAGMRAQACEATRLRGEQSEALMDRRMACLDGTLRDFKALTEALSVADARAVEHAVEAAVALPAIERCADTNALLARVRPPDSAAAAEVERIRNETSAANVLGEEGRYADGERMLAPMRDLAKATGYRALEGEVDLAWGQVQTHLGDPSAGDPSLYAAVEAAEAAGDDEVKARALVELTSNLGKREAKFDEATRAGRLAGAVLTRLVADVDLSAQLEDALSAVDDGQGRYEEALERSQRAVAIRTAAFGPDDYRVASSLNACSAHLFFLGRYAEQLEMTRRVLSIYEGTLGARHPQVAVILRNMAIAEDALYAFDDALRDARRAIAIWLEAFGEDNPDLPSVEGIVIEIDLHARRPAEALDIAERALARSDKLHTTAIDTVDTMNSLAAIYDALGRYDDALAVLARAQAICKSHSNPPFEWALTLHFQGLAYLGKGQARRAIAPLEESRAIRKATAASPMDIADGTSILARALWDGGGDRKRAVELAHEALGAYTSEAKYDRERGEIEDWLATHAPR